MVPSVMAQWITTIVAPDSGVEASTLESKGLGVLKVRDLKRIRSSIYATGCVSSPQRVPSGASKNKLVDSIHALLKTDNHRLLSHIRADLQPMRQHQNTNHAAHVPSAEVRRSCQPTDSHNPPLPHSTPTMQTADSSTCSSGRKRPAQHISNSAVPNLSGMSYTGEPYPGYRAAVLSTFLPYGDLHTTGTSGTMPQNGSTLTQTQTQNYLDQAQIPSFIGTAASYPPSAYQYFPGGGSNGQHRSSNPTIPQAVSNAIHFASTTGSQRNRPGNFIPNNNGEKSVTGSSEEENIPRTPQEFSFFNQLLEMGFQDRKEVMQGIRQSDASSADEIMLWIIQQREEREEARKMDEARLRSEQLRKENAEKQERAFQERLNAATSRDDFRKIYGHSSWVLENLGDIHFRRLVSHHKVSLVRLLKLESNARKWYQDKLPVCYFKDLCHRSNQQAENEFDSWLMKECDALESGLYKLELQQGGVPKLFIQAQESHPEYGEQEDIDGSDDEIVFCGTRQLNEGV